MADLLLGLIFALSAVIIMLLTELHRSTRRHAKKISLLEHIIIKLSADNKTQQNKVQLSEDLGRSMRKAENILVNDIADLQYEFLRILTNQNK
jgi:hypothetical protein